MRAENGFSIPSQPPHGDLEEMGGSLERAVMARKITLIETTPRRHHLGPLPRQVKPRRGAFHNLQNSSYAGQEDWSGSASASSPSDILLLFLGITQQSTSRWIRLMSVKSHHHHQPLTLVRGRRAREGKAPSLTHRPAPPASPTRSFPSVPRQQWVLNRGKQTAAPPSSKRETDESGAFSSRKATMHADRSLENIACVLLAQQKTQRSCVSSGVK